MRNSMGNDIKGRVLFTGSGDLVINDLMEHMPSSFRLEKCPPVELKLIHALERFRPHVIIAVLSEQSNELLQMCYILEENTQYYELPMLVVGSRDACTIFEKNVFQKKVEIFQRPLNRDQFMASLDAHVAHGISDEIDQETAKMAAAKPPVQEEVREEPAAVTDRKSILVVDDDVRMLNAIKLYLQDLYDVTVVPSGKLALKFLAKKHADLVLLDYMMPIEDGPMVLRQIRETSPEPNVPVLFLTGVNDKDMVLRCIELRPKGYLLKPITRDALLDRVVEILLEL